MGIKKGMGSRLNNSLTLDKRVKLFDWCKAHKDSVQSFDELTAMATADLGFTVSTSCMQNHWRACNGSRRINNQETLAAKVAAIETRMAECERRLSEAGA